MPNVILVDGIVMTEPVFTNGASTFTMNVEGTEYKIIRLEPKWQKKDILFLRVGQAVRVEGIPAPRQENAVLVLGITITKSIPDRGDDDNGSESIRKTD